MRLMLTLLLVPLSSCFSGGSPNSGSATDASTQPDAIGVCTLTLEECENCPRTEMTARVNAAAIICDNGGTGVAVAGQCGSFRFVEWSGGFGGQIHYYDGEDQLVGASFSTDTPEYCGGTSFVARVGTIPTCERLQDIDLCAPGG